MKHAILLLFVLCAIASACEDSSEKPLNSEARKAISQRYADTVRVLTPIVDSLCTANQEQLATQLADSLYEVRIADLNRQRKRFQQ